MTVVRLTRDDGRPLWEIRSAVGSRQTTYRVGATPPGFREVVPFHGLTPRARVDGPDGKPAMELRAAPERGILRGDGSHVTPTQFAAGRDDYCAARRQDRAATLAIGFAFLVVGLLFMHRWLRAKRSRNPHRRPWLLP